VFLGTNPRGELITSGLPIRSCLAANANLIPDFLPPVTSFRLGAHSFACEEVLAERVAFEPSSEVFLQRDTDHCTVNRGPR
jgi:hypothetical protein